MWQQFGFDLMLDGPSRVRAGYLKMPQAKECKQASHWRREQSDSVGVTATVAFDFVLEDER